MVDVNFIVKSIDNAIRKCRVGGGLSNRVKGILNRFARDSKNYRNEKALIITPHGNVIYENDGDVSSVHLPSDRIVDLVEEYGGDFSIEHNHPYRLVTADGEEKLLPTCLSDGDMDRLLDRYYIDGVYVTPYKSISCECFNGNRMTLNRTGIEEDNVVANNTNIGEFRERYDKAKENLTKAYSEFCNSITRTDGVLEQHMHDWLKEWDKNNINNQRLYSQENFDWKQVEFPSDEEYYTEKNKFIQEYVRDNYKKFLIHNISEFKELGFDLDVEWVDV